MLEGDDEARRLFAAALGTWEDLQLHETLVGYCARTGQLPFAARCYRERLRADPHDAVARRQQARVVLLAEQAFLERPREQRDGPLGSRGWLVVVILGLFAGVLAWATLPLWSWW